MLGNGGEVSERKLVYVGQAVAGRDGKKCRMSAGQGREGRGLN